MMHKFKKGEIVECIREDYNVKVGQLYVVSRGNFMYEGTIECIELEDHGTLPYLAEYYITTIIDIYQLNNQQ